MMNTLHFILKSRLKHSKILQKSSGFTLIELLIALVIAFLIITPLLTFMIGVLNTDQQEQAKASSEDDIQTAINYITRDLQQAIYIYDAAGITAIASKLRYPTDTSKTPILVFWKRDLVTGVVPQNTGSDDTFIYSLVVYYIDNSTSTTWSKAARISRWQIKDGVESTSGVTCTGYTKKYVSGYCPDPGFSPFNDSFGESDSLDVGMKQWKLKTGVTYPTASYTNDAVVLVDFVDQSTSSVPAATCPANVPDPSDSTNTNFLVKWSTIKPTSMTGFYACVNSTDTATNTVGNNVAQVFIRGNALARIKNTASQINYSDSKKSYFPSINVRVQGKGYLDK